MEDSAVGRSPWKIGGSGVKGYEFEESEDAIFEEERDQRVRSPGAGAFVYFIGEMGFARRGSFVYFKVEYFEHVAH